MATHQLPDGSCRTQPESDLGKTRSDTARFNGGETKSQFVKGNRIALFQSDPNSKAIHLFNSRIDNRNVDREFKKKKKKSWITVIESKK